MYIERYTTLKIYTNIDMRHLNILVMPILCFYRNFSIAVPTGQYRIKFYLVFDLSVKPVSINPILCFGAFISMQLPSWNKSFQIDLYCSDEE